MTHAPQPTASHSKPTVQPQRAQTFGAALSKAAKGARTAQLLAGAQAQRHQSDAARCQALSSTEQARVKATAVRRGAERDQREAQTVEVQDEQRRALATSSALNARAELLEKLE